jgi:hypothetical protein
MLGNDSNKSQVIMAMINNPYTYFHEKNEDFVKRVTNKYKRGLNPRIPIINKHTIGKLSRKFSSFPCTVSDNLNMKTKYIYIQRAMRSIVLLITFLLHIFWPMPYFNELMVMNYFPYYYHESGWN